MNLLNRLTALERKTTATDGAWLAFINEDGSVSLSHHLHGKIELTSREALQSFISDNSLNSGNAIKIIIIDSLDCKGAEPMEL